MPLGQSQCIPQADPGGVATPRFWHRLIRFRHVISGSLALASLKHTCRNLVPTFPQRSPPLHLTTAACGDLRSTPDCRPRRAFLHLSYSCAPPCGPAILVTQCQLRTRAAQQKPIIRSPRRRAAALAARRGRASWGQRCRLDGTHSPSSSGLLRWRFNAIDTGCARNTTYAKNCGHGGTFESWRSM